TQMGGPEADEALLAIARGGTSNERRAALQSLVQAGNPEATELVLELARSGGRSERQSYLYMLGELGGEAAREALLSIAREDGGTIRMQAIEMLRRRHPGDPEVQRLLIESFESGRRDEMGQAAHALARSGSPEAREALVAAMRGGDRARAMAAAGAAGEMLGDPDVLAAMLELARGDDEQVAHQVLSRLVTSGMPEGLEAAAEALRGGDPARARAAAQALSFAPGGKARQL